MKRDSFVMQSGLALRALAVIIVILTATTTAWAEEITIDLADGHGSATFSEESLVFSKCEALEVGFTFDIPLEVMTQSKMYAGVVMQRYTATLDNGDVVDGVLTGEIDVVSSQTYSYKVTGNEMTRQPVSVSMTRSRSTNGPVEIATWSGFRKGAASFTFDDGAPSHVSDAGPVFDKYGYKATFNLVYNWNPNWSGFQGMADNGHEIASHSNSHGNNMSGEEASSKQNIKGKITQKYGVITVAYPNCNVPNESTVLQNYIVGRICNGSWQGMSDNMGKDGPSNWAKVPAIMTGAEGSLKTTNDFTGQMQKVVQSNGWVAFLTHGFQGKNNGNATYSPTDLGAIDGALKWAQQNDKDIWVAPMGHVAMYIKERKASKVEVTQSDEFSMTITLTHEIADNVSNYDYPLSLRVSSGWTNVAVTQNGAKLESKDDGGYIYFDAIPNGGDIVVTNNGIYCGNTAVNDGKNVVWEYDATTKTLTIRKNPKASEISGEDYTMMDFVNGAEAPWAFYRSSITTVYVEDGVQGIGNSAFDGCTNLKTVYVLRDNTDGITALGTDVFKNCHDDLSIYVFATALSDYQNAENWSTYASKLKGLGSKIPYLDWDDTEKKLVKKTTPADVGVLVLDGTESELGTAGQETWYVCNTPVSDEKPNGLEYNGKLTLNGDVHLILADGCKMTIYPGENDENAYSLYGSNSDLAIYGQGGTDATGKSTEGQLTVTALLVGIDVNSLTINGGQVIASSKGEGIVIWTLEDITINGGQVTVKSNDGPKGIYAERDVTINGGQVMVTETNCQDGIYADRDVTINGGQVTATVKKGSGINARGNVIISGGQVEAIGTNGIMATGYKDNQNNIWVDGNVTISGGKVTATGTKDSGIGIEAYNDIFISGGQVEATGTRCGIFCNNSDYIARTITLGWSSVSNYITASSIDFFIAAIGTVKITQGKYFFVDGTTTVLGSADADYELSADELTAIAGKKLLPIEGIPTDGVAYIAFTNGSGNRKPLGDDVQVYAVIGYDLTAGQVYLKSIEGNVIPEGMPVVIGNKTEDDPLPANIFLVGSDAQTTTVEGLLKGFVACDGSKTVQEYLDESFGEGVSASDYIPYLLKGGTFKAVLVNAADVIKQDICLLFIPKWDVLTGKSVGSTNAARSIAFGGDETTAIIDNSQLTIDNWAGAWYDMQGRRIEKPTRKGLYIRNGVKVVIK